MTSPQSLIEQAAEEYALSFVRYGGLRWPRLDVDKLEAFKAGAQWRDEQMELDSLKARVEICSLKQKLEAMEERDEQVKEVVEMLEFSNRSFEFILDRTTKDLGVKMAIAQKQIENNKKALSAFKESKE